jgi:hypothetical protein
MAADRLRTPNLALFSIKLFKYLLYNSPTLTCQLLKSLLLLFLLLCHLGAIRVQSRWTQESCIAQTKHSSFFCRNSVLAKTFTRRTSSHDYWEKMQTSDHWNNSGIIDVYLACLCRPPCQLLETSSFLQLTHSSYSLPFLATGEAAKFAVYLKW